MAFAVPSVDSWIGKEQIFQPGENPLVGGRFQLFPVMLAGNIPEMGKNLSIEWIHQVAHWIQSRQSDPLWRDESGAFEKKSCRENRA